MVKVRSYERPLSLDEVLAMVRGEDTILIGGGTGLHLRDHPEPVRVVDLQAAGLGGIQRDEDGTLRIGATTTLQQLADDDHVPSVVREAARREAPSTLRTLATLGGCVATADSESELLAALLAYDATVTTAASGETHLDPLTDVLRNLQREPGILRKRVITAITIETSGVASATRVGRTPADRAIVAAVARRTPTGELRLALTGVAPTPILVPDGDHLDPTGDFRGSSEYRRALAATLSSRALEALR